MAPRVIVIGGSAGSIDVLTSVLPALPADWAGAPLARGVTFAVPDYLDCGVLAHGFARVRCKACGDGLLVAFSCKGRGICPSCTTRRAHDTAAHLTDAVLPAVPLRQWVLTFPRRIRFLFARRPGLTSKALATFLRALFALQRRRARALGLSGEAGAVTFVQRFGSALQLNLHMHVVAPDGLFGADAAGDGVFHRLPPPKVVA